MRSRTMQRVAPGRRLAALFLTLVALALTACGSTATIRDAQDAFSQAAALDNASGMRSGELPNIHPATGELGSMVAARGAVAPSYERAHALITSVILSDETELKQNELLGHALTLQAMCEWRLGEWNAAQATAKKALEQPTEALGPRDHAILMAMPGMIRNDQAFTMLQRWRAAGTVTPAEVAAAQALLIDTERGAVAHLEKARALASDHPIAVYLILSELAALKNLQDVAYVSRSLGVVPPDTRDQTERTTKLIAELVRRTPPGDTRDAMVDAWKDGLGL